MIDYIKKPVKIQAAQWTGNNLGDISELFGDKKLDCNETSGEISIQTLEGTMVANIGDYIIKGIKGELYPCKPDIFKATYYTKKEYAECQE